MAKTRVRRIIRKRKIARAEPFDEQLWPIQLTLVILGGFLIGLVFAYLRFDDLRWWANALTWLVITPIAVGFLMVLARFVDRRWMRRAVQFSLALCVLFHAILAMVMWESVIFRKIFPQNREAAHVVRRERVVIPDFHSFQLHSQQRAAQDFLQPVATETPEPEEQTELRQEPIEQPDPVEQAPPQPQPVPEPQPTVRAAEMEQRRPSETAPRTSEQQSRLNRQTVQTAPQAIAQAVIAPQAPRPAAHAASPPLAVAIPIERQTTETPVERRPVNQEPAAASEQVLVQLARRETQLSPTPETTAAPMLQRRVSEPEIAPRTQAEPAPQVASARQTEPNQPQPSRVAITRQTVAPPVEVTPTQVPEAAAQTAAQVRRRQVDSAEAPTVAQAPRPNPQQRTAALTRPEIAMPAENPAPSSALQPAPARPKITPQTNPLQRQEPALFAQRATRVETPAPAPAQQTAPSALSRRETQESAMWSAESAAQPLRKRATQEIAAAITPAQPTAAPGATAPSLDTTPRPSSTAVAMQTTSSPLGTAEPSTDIPVIGDSATGSRAVARRLPAESAPTIARTPSPTSGQRRTFTTTPRGSATDAGPISESAPVVASAPAEIRPSTSAVARQATSGPVVSQNPLALKAPSASPSLQAARPSATRAQSVVVPSVNPQATPSPRSQRSAITAGLAASPAPVESPALAEASQTTGRPSPQPAQMALARGEAGVAGIGASVNLDRAAPTDAGASEVASGSATRATARSANAGPELSPSAPALVARANAGDPAPTSTLQAAEVALPNVLGAPQPSEINASASAALAQANSQAEPASISAAAGTVEVDIGPTRVVATQGASRGEGGGQPELNSQQQSRLAARSAASGAPHVALATPTTAESVAAPAGVGGGEPPRPHPQIDALAAVAANPGGAEPISGGPSAATQTGPTTESSGATEAGPTKVARAETREAPPGAAQSGGGADDPNENNRPPQLARSIPGGAPDAAAPTADLLAGAGPSAPGSSGSPDEDDEDERLAAMAALQNAIRRTQIGGILPNGGAAQVGPPSEPSDAAMAGPVQLARAETVAAALGAPEAGGGFLSRTEPSSGPQFAATLRADAPSLAGAPASSGRPETAPLASSAGELNVPTPGGILSQAVAGPTGAIEGPELIDAPRGGQPGPQLGRRAASSATSEGPLLADATNLGSLGRRQTQVALAGGLTADAAPALPDGAPAGEGAVPDMAAVAADLDEMGEMDMSELALQAAGGARPVSVPAPEGPGGVGQTLTADSGLANRRGQPEAETIHFREARFVRREVGGAPAVNLTAAAPAEAFAQRLRPKKKGEQAGGGGGPPPLTEEAIELGLVFLARHQMPDGSWSFADFGRGQPGYENETAALESDVAATGLALLAFQGGGYTHLQGKYQDTVRKGLEFLLRNQRQDGDLYLRTRGPSDAAMWLYSHGVASLALTEAYGMTQDAALKQPTQKALNFIVAAQHKSRGGWRYSPNYGSDTSVTGWMMMALKSGELAGLSVPSETFANVEKWLDSAQKSPTERHLYVYNPLAPNTAQQRHGRRPNPTMTSVGLLMRLYTGWRRDNPHLVAGAEHLLSNPPAVGTRREPQRDAYYWYYATQVLFHMGGEYWKAWNDQLHPLLIESQEKTGPLAGSWDARNPVPDRWGPHCGRLYVTTLNLLSLEVYYRHLPLYVETGK